MPNLKSSRFRQESRLRGSDGEGGGANSHEKDGSDRPGSRVKAPPTELNLQAPSKPGTSGG